jgi:hypothetical protein
METDLAGGGVEGRQVVTLEVQAVPDILLHGVGQVLGGSLLVDHVSKVCILYCWSDYHCSICAYLCVRDLSLDCFLIEDF